MTTKDPPLPSPDIAGSAKRVGTYVWLSSRLFEVTGQWAGDRGAPSVTAGMVKVSSRFSWQAGQWYDRLPLLAEVDRSLLIRSPGPRAEARFAELTAAGPQVQRLSALSLVVHDLDMVYEAHLRGARDHCDGAVIRTIHRVRTDLREVLAGVVALGGSDASGSVTAASSEDLVS